MEGREEEKKEMGIGQEERGLAREKHGMREKRGGWMGGKKSRRKLG